MYQENHNSVQYTSVGIENQDKFYIGQLDGNMSCDSSFMNGSLCSCCDRISECGTMSSYDPEYDDIGQSIPVLRSLGDRGHVYDDCPAWYDE